VPHRLPPLIAATKTLASTPRWTAVEAQLDFTVSLDIESVTQIGLRLRGRCLRDYADQNLSLQIEYLFQGLNKPVPVIRLDWRPLKPHNNRNIGPERWRLIPFHCSHFHPFVENHDWMMGNGLPFTDNIKANLPIALPLEDDPADVAAVLVLMGRVFQIDGVTAIPVPPWQAPRLL